MKLLFLILICAGLTFGCSASQEDVPQENIAQGGGDDPDSSVGPFDLKLAQNGGIESNQFSIQIAQNEGKVEFNLSASPNTIWMKIRSHLASVTGCDADQVEVAHLWEGKADGNPKIVAKDDYFSSLPDEAGQLTVVFKNMKGCNTLTYKLIVDEIVDPYEIPKSWSFQVDKDFLGDWENASEALEVQVDDSYINLISNKASYCFRSIPNIATDTSQVPHFIGHLTGDDVLCEYHFVEDGDAVDLTCHNISNWLCPSISKVRLTSKN